MNIRPLNDRVVVRRNEEEETTSGGIILTAASKEKPNQGEVVAVGPGKTLDNGDIRSLAVNVGDTVVFGRYADSNTIKNGDDELIIISSKGMITRMGVGDVRTIGRNTQGVRLMSLADDERVVDLGKIVTDNQGESGD